MPKVRMRIVRRAHPAGTLHGYNFYIIDGGGRELGGPYRSEITAKQELRKKIAAHRGLKELSI